MLYFIIFIAFQRLNNLTFFFFNFSLYKQISIPVDHFFSLFSECPLLYTFLFGGGIQHHIHCDNMLYDSKILIFTTAFYSPCYPPSHFVYSDCKYKHRHQKLTELSETRFLTHSPLLWICNTMNMWRLIISGQVVFAFLSFSIISSSYQPLQSANLCHMPIRLSSQKENHWFTREHKRRLSKGNCPKLQICGLFTFRPSRRQQVCFSIRTSL